MRNKFKATGLGIALGAALGAAASVILGQTGLWLAIGVAIGLVIGGIFGRSQCPTCAAVHKTHKAES
jgi:predicted lysophospholipase L1 biosynthesis ABC-type transport system permease subunit